MKAHISSAITFIGFIALLEAGDAPAQSAGGALGLTISANQSIYHPGDKLTVAVSIDDPGIAANADFFFALLLPDGSIHAFTDAAFNFVTCSMANLAACHPIVGNVPLAAPFTFDQPAFFTHDWTGAEAVGDYTVIAAAVVHGTLADNSVDPGDLIAVSMRGFSLDPGATPPTTGTTTPPPTTGTTTPPPTTGTTGLFSQLSGTYTMSLTSDTGLCGKDFNNAGPYQCVVTQSGSTVTFNCTPPVPGFGTMTLDFNGFTLFNFLRDDGRAGNCSMQFIPGATPSRYHAFCVVKGHGGVADTCGFDGTQ